MSFSCRDGDGDFEYNGASPNGLFAQPLAPRQARRSTGCCSTCCASTARRGRCSGRRRRPARSASSSTRARLLARLRRAADRAAGLRGLVGRPGADVGRSRAASWPSSSTTTACSRSATGRAGARSPAARGATWSALTAPFARPHPPVHAGAVDRAHARPGSSWCRAGGEPERFDQVVIAAHSDQALAMLADPSRAEREVLGAIPYQANEAVLHTDARPAAAPPPRLGELELPPRGRAHRQDDRDLPHEPPAVAALALASCASR